MPASREEFYFTAWACAGEIDAANLMLWTFQCGSFVEGTFWYALKSRSLNSRLLKMSGFLHKSHMHSLPDTHQTPEPKLSGSHTGAHVHLSLTWGPTHPVEKITKDGTEGQHPLWSLLKNITLFNTFSPKFTFWSDWRSKRLCQNVLSLQVLCL